MVVRRVVQGRGGVGAFGDTKNRRGAISWSQVVAMRASAKRPLCGRGVQVPVQRDEQEQFLREGLYEGRGYEVRGWRCWEGEDKSTASSRLSNEEVHGGH